MSPDAEIRDKAIAARRAELLTVKEFADIARIHPLSVYRRIREGRQPGVIRIGRDIRIDVGQGLQSGKA